MFRKTIKKTSVLFLTAVMLFLLSVNVFALESDDSSAEAAKQPEKCYELVTGENEEYYSKITINSHSILVDGCYKSDPVTNITFQNCGTVSSTLKVNGDGTFSSVLNPSEPVGNSDRIVITLKSGAELSYLIMYNDNWYFPDNKLGEQNLSVLEKTVPTSAKSWAGYVTDELTEESVRQTLDEVAYLANYIAGDIKDEYKKLEAISKWVSDNIYYDRDARENSVTQSEICIKNVLRERKTVCVGYSALFSALCEAQGIYVVNVKGTATSNTVSYDDLADGPVNHEWCAALINDRWVWVDCVWDSALKFENNEFRSLGPNTQMYFDISPLALSFDHCAYLAEKRYYFRAEEYFGQASESTSQSITENATDSKPESDLSTSDTSKPQTYTAPENYSPVTSNITAQEEHTSNSSLIWITLLSVAAVAALMINIINIRWIKKNKNK